jgi:hypothetical protein
MDSSQLFGLPTELIFRILDFIEPDEYSGLSCTCQRALALTNQKLYLEGIYTAEYLDMHKSYTGIYVMMRGFRLAPARVVPPEGHLESGTIESMLAAEFSDPDL